eukprot:Polyplicarium_translucidae@DN2840_c0_g2_i3.p1
MSASKRHQLSYKGENFLRQRIVLSLLSGRPFRVTGIRENDPLNVGLRPHEETLLEIVMKISDETVVTIDSTGTALQFSPGRLEGGEFSITCRGERALTYYLEPLLLLAPFMKFPLDARLHGWTCCTESDESVDTFRVVAVPFLRRIGIEEGEAFEVIRRGLRPNGGGTVRFRCPILRIIEPFQLVNPGRVKRVRGVAYAVDSSNVFTTRMISAARAPLNSILPDVWIYVDAKTGSSKSLTRAEKRDSVSRGYGMTLVAETSRGIVYGADGGIDEGSGALKEELRKAAAAMDESTLGETDAAGGVLMEAEVLGRGVASRLLLEVSGGGAIDTTHQYVPIVFMACSDESRVSKVVLPTLTPYTIEYLRHIHDFMGVQFDVSQLEPDVVMLKCVGSGVRNIARPTF